MPTVIDRNGTKRVRENYSLDFSESTISLTLRAEWTDLYGPRKPCLEGFLGGIAVETWEKIPEELKTGGGYPEILVFNESQIDLLAQVPELKDYAERFRARLWELHLPWAPDMAPTNYTVQAWDIKAAQDENSANNT